MQKHQIQRNKYSVNISPLNNYIHLNSAETLPVMEQIFSKY